MKLVLFLILMVNSVKAGTVAADFTSATTIPVTASGYTATGNDVSLSLAFAPPTGTSLMVVKNTGLGFIDGHFSNLAQGQSVNLTYLGLTYPFVANYYGGTGNDLVLQWAYQDAYSWGQNSFGELGNNSSTNSSVPVLVTKSGVLAGKTVISVAGGESHSLALCSDGTVAAWGENSFGQLGNNGTTNSSLPVIVTSTGVLAGRTVISVAAGDRHSVALCSDGRVASWGPNDLGQLGNNGTTGSKVPVLVSNTGVLAGKTVVSVVAGRDSSLALCSDGTLATWGGSTGTGVPVALTSTGALAGKAVVAVAVGGPHSLALCSDGTVAAWGDNSYGQLGNNTTGYEYEPVAVTRTGVLAGKTVVSLAACGTHSLAVCSDGTVAAWGWNYFGQLGNNSTTDSSVPVLVTRTGVLAGKTVVSLAGGYSHSLAQCSDGTVAAWGYNTMGQLGNNSMTDSRVPVLVTKTGVLAGKSLVSVADGNFYSLALAAGPLSNISSLSGLALSNGSLSPAFSAGNKTYTASVTNATTSMTVTPTATSAKSTLQVNGITVVSGAVSQSIPLVVGTNTITILVTAEDGTTSTYALTVTRVSAVSSLSGLALSNGTLSPVFATGTNSYSATVPSGTSSITVTATSNHPGASLKVNNITVSSGAPSQSVALNPGRNTITVVCTAQDGISTSTYTVNVTRISNVATLSSIFLSSGVLSPSFASGTYSYHANVTNTTTDMTLVPTLVDSTASMSVNGVNLGSGSASQSIPLAVGNNIITVLVTAQDGTTTHTYTLTITRAPSVVSTLSGLELNSGTLSPAFSSVTTNYAASVANPTTTISVTPTVSDPTASVKVNGTIVASGSASAGIPLVVGVNTITVQVTAQDGITKSTYTVSVSRAPSAVCSLSSLTTNEGVFSPAFDPGIAAYNISVFNEVTTIAVTPTTTDATATVKVNGESVSSGSPSAPIPLIEGNNTITVVVTAQDGISTFTHTVIVTRQLPSSVCNLTGIHLSTGTLDAPFDPEVSSYSMTCSNSISSITVASTASDPSATIQINGTASGALGTLIPLDVGENNVSIVVTAGDSISTRTYTVRITRLPLVFSYVAAGQIAVDVPDYSASGPLDLTLGFAPPVGTCLTVVRQGGLPFISGRFSNLAQGQTIALAYGGRSYHFTANYYGGSGNDLMLEWPYTWASASGSNTSGHLGDNTTNSSSNPVETDRSGVLENKTILATSAGSAHSMALCADGTLAAWGSNSVGQLGDGGSSNSSVPVAVNTDGVLSGKTVIAIAGGANHNLALCEDGRVVAWGNNTLGQLGNGGNAASNLPVAVSTGGVLSGKTVVAIAAGANHSLALCSDGTLAAWGSNNSGQLGNGGTLASNVPVLVNRGGVLVGKTISSIAAGTSHSLALCDDGTMTAWGANGFGQLGDGTWIGATQPVQVNAGGLLAGRVPVSLTAGGNHSLALCQDGLIVAWGYNATGQLGNGNTTESNVPVEVSSSGVLVGKTPVSLAAGSNHSLALCSDGTVAAWGLNSNGQLGDGSTTTRLLPVALVPQGMLAGQPVMRIAAGQLHTLLVTEVSNSAELASLTPSSGSLSPAFDSLAAEYTLDVPNITTTITLTPVTAANNSAVTINGLALVSGTASQQVSLSVGANKITVRCTAQDGLTAKAYTVTVTRDPSAVATLSGLAVSKGALAPAFAPASTSYMVNLANSISSIRITPTATDSTATVKVQGSPVASGSASTPIPLAVGTNTIKVIVTAQDGITTRSYTLRIMRSKSSDATLSGLVVKTAKLSPAFKPAKKNYTAIVPLTTISVKISATAHHNNSTIKVNGKAVKSGTPGAAIPLELGKNTITIAVTAEDGNVRTYKIVVTRNKHIGTVPKSALSHPAASVETHESTTVVAGQRYLQLTVVKPAPGSRQVIEVSPNLVDWFSGETHTTTVKDDGHVLTVRDNTPVSPGVKRFIRVRP